MNVFPVPAHNTIFINAVDDQKKYTTADRHGRVITKLKSGSNDISELSTGLYFILDNNKTVSRIIRK
ncbi:MAG: T9SS type A sorting domain-containing protein [Bacteroidales bacterium]